MNPEHEAGIRARFSRLERAEGTIKNSPDDFHVEEIPGEITRDDNGKYLIIRVRLNDWDTSSFVTSLARALQISRKRVSFSGTKDKKAITEQYFCINAPVSGVPYLGPGIEIIETFRSNTLLRLGYLRGNRFMIRVGSAGTINDRVSEIASFIMQNGGFPNFYGIQRFGSVRPITHRVGRYILQGRMEDAAMEYLYDPEFDSEDYRKAFFDTRDVKVALRDFPNSLRFERSILGRIEETGKLSEGLSRVPIELGKMFVHAYQSRVFNILLSNRIGNSTRMDDVFPGDVCYSVDEFFNPEREPVKAELFNMDKIKALSVGSRLRPTLPVPGYDTVFATPEEEAEVMEIISADDLTLRSFRVPHHPELSSRGERRIVSSIPVGFSLPEKNVMEFALGRGTYATSFIREMIREYSD